MAKKIGFLFLCILGVNGFIPAQQLDKADSVWLQNVIEGKEELKINDETKKAIDEGRLIVPSEMNNSEIIKVDPISLPPGVFSYYILYMDKLDSIYQNITCLLTREEKEMILQSLPYEARNRIYYNATTGGIGGMDFNHLLSMIFSPTYRRRVHNAKYATAYKCFNTSPSYKLTERDRTQLRKEVYNLKAHPISVSVSVKKSGPLD